MLKILLKKQLSSFFSSIVSNRNAKNKPSGKKSSVGMIILVSVLMGYLIFALLMMMFGLATVLCRPAVESGYKWFYFALPFALCFVLSVFLGLFSSQSQIFNANDNELLLSMPIRPRDILASRLIVMMAPDYLIEILVAAVFGAVYVFNYGATPIGVLLVCLVTLVMPLLALAVYSLIGWIISLITARIKRKQLISNVISISFFILYFFGYSKIMEMTDGLDEGIESGEFFSVFASFADKLEVYFPPIKWIGSSIADHSALNTLLVLAMTLIPFAIVLCLLSRSFIGIVTAKSGTAKTRYNAEKSVKTASAGKALYKRELKRMLSSSVYLINAGFGVIMLVLVAVLLVTEENLRGVGDIIAAEMPSLSRILPAGAALILCLISSTVTFTASSVSLEGKYLWIVKTLPIDYEKLLMSKVAAHMTFVAPASLIASGILCIIAKPTWVELVPYFLLPLLFNLFSAMFGLVLNLRFPKLDWISEAQPVKQSLASFLGMFAPMLIGLILGVGIIGASVAVAISTGMAWAITLGMAALGIVFAILSLIFYNVIKKWGVRRFAAI